MTQPFYSSKQNQPENIELLKASNVAYNNAKANEFKFSYVFLGLAVLYPVAYIFLKNEDIKHGLFAVSLCLTVFYQLFANWFKGKTTLGAMLKEEFDLSVFGLPRKFMNSELEPVDTGRLANQYKGGEIKDWYSPNIKGEIPKNTIIAICQRINCKWDIDLRKEFNKFLITLVIALFLLMFSLASCYTHFITMIRGNYSAMSKREKIILKLDSYINHKKDFLTENLRDVQDEILSARQEPQKCLTSISRNSITSFT